MDSRRVLVVSLVACLAACGSDPAPADGGGASDGGMDAAAHDAGSDVDAGGGVDAGPPQPCDSPGAIETVACGSCGTVERFCTATRTWSYGVCSDEGECAPGSTDSVACGSCGTQQRRCTTECAWETVGACTDEGECEPGTRTRSGEGCPAGSTREVVCSAACELEPAGECVADGCPTLGEIQTVACGMCGSQQRFCAAGGVWEYDPCVGERTCLPGTSRSVACGMCGTRTERCDATCTWIAAACGGEGTCAPGTTTRTSEGCPAGQTRLVRCTDACTLTEVVEPCTAPVMDAGVDAGRDAGMPDAGRDAGPPDAGMRDAGSRDAGPPPVTIGAVQRGEIAAGTFVTIRGVVVTAVRSDTIWVQDPAGGGTYAGVKVYVGGAHGALRNDRVDVSGTVQEYFGDTEITSASVTVTGVATAIPALPLTVAQASLEQYEGMLVRLTDITSYQYPYSCSADSPLCVDTDLWQVNGASGIIVYGTAYEGSDWLSQVGASSVTGVMTWRFERRRIQPRIATDLP
jgi:hypothetical protein